MDQATRIAFVQAQTAIFYCRLEGMKAENQQRTFAGHAPAYVEAEFTALEKDFMHISTKVLLDPTFSISAKEPRA